MSPEEAPWSVFISTINAEGATLCSGSIIAPNAVLTAAHCVFDGAQRRPASRVRGDRRHRRRPARRRLDADPEPPGHGGRGPSRVRHLRGAATTSPSSRVSTPFDLSGAAVRAIPLAPAGAATGPVRVYGWGRSTPTTPRRPPALARPVARAPVPLPQRRAGAAVRPVRDRRDVLRRQRRRPRRPGPAGEAGRRRVGRSSPTTRPIAASASAPATSTSRRRRSPQWLAGNTAPPPGPRTTGARGDRPPAIRSSASPRPGRGDDRGDVRLPRRRDGPAAAVRPADVPADGAGPRPPGHLRRGRAQRRRDGRGARGGARHDVRPRAWASRSRPTACSRCRGRRRTPRSRGSSSTTATAGWSAPPALDLSKPVTVPKLPAGRYQVCVESDPTPTYVAGSACRPWVVAGKAASLVAAALGQALARAVARRAAHLARAGRQARDAALEDRDAAAPARRARVAVRRKLSATTRVNSPRVPRARVIRLTVTASALSLRRRARTPPAAAR